MIIEKWFLKTVVTITSKYIAYLRKKIDMFNRRLDSLIVIHETYEAELMLENQRILNKQEDI